MLVISELENPGLETTDSIFILNCFTVSALFKVVPNYNHEIGFAKSQ